LRFAPLSSGDAQDMYVLALVTQKGGSGKSTLAVGLAVAAMERGEHVAFVEADSQGTISKWKERRGNTYPRVIRVADPTEIERALSHLEAEGIWLGIIDTPPRTTRWPCAPSPGLIFV
jgi:chromosome partitioning protein